jgi:transposase
MKKYIVRLSKEEREQLEKVTSVGKAAVYKIKHAQILLKSDVDGPNWADEQIAEAFCVTTRTVENIRKRLVEKGLDAALDRKKQETPRRKSIFDGEGEARVIALSCSSPPEGYSKWTVRLLADKIVELEIVETVSYETVRQTLKKTRLNLT